MTLTLSNCIERINQALDYPALEYADISHYFDQAISELNTTLRIGLRPITQLLADNEFDIGKHANIIALDRAPTSAQEDYLRPLYKAPDTYVETDEGYSDDLKDLKYYYDTVKAQFGIKKSDGWYYYFEIYGYVNDFALDNRLYVSMYYTDEMVMWVPFDDDPLTRLDLTVYLPVDVIILFMIPYICYKYTIRDGGDGQLFREEFMEGFQQIQTSYDIPNTVSLVKMAGKKAYVTDVQENVENLNITVPTRAIYDTMKIGNAVMPTYGGFYEDGGWGI